MAQMSTPGGHISPCCGREVGGELWGSLEVGAGDFGGQHDVLGGLGEKDGMGGVTEVPAV